MQQPSPKPNFISTGIVDLDRIIDGLRVGDNVVWRLEQIADYPDYVTHFVSAAREAERSIIYIRFARHEALVKTGHGIRVVSLDPRQGFAAFTEHCYQLVNDHGRGAFYVFDCLTELLEDWATDHMVASFFQVICPLLFELDTVAYFALLSHRHSHETLQRIRTTTQVMLDVRHAHGETQIQPIKAWQRQSPTMFLPHARHGDTFLPVVDSSEATHLQEVIEQQYQQHRQDRILDHWDRLFLEASRALEDNTTQTERKAIQRRILEVMISREPRILSMTERFLDLRTLLAIRNRMIGTGSVGGKATGMLLARRILESDSQQGWRGFLEPHDSFHVGSDVYYAYLVSNGLWPTLMRQRTETHYFSEASNLRAGILKGRFPEAIRAELARLLDHFGQYPVVVRSSSLLEDGFGNAFAGKYESIFCVNQGDPETRLEELEQAMRAVYASSMSDEALHYRRQRQLDRMEEPMALLIQRVNGRYHGSCYLPDAAGVAVSRNIFAWSRNMDPAAGMIRMVMGLGTRAVDRIENDHARVFALDNPNLHPFHNAGESHQYSQHLVDLLNISENSLQSLSLLRLAGECESFPFSRLAELDTAANRRARELGQPAQVWRPTFKPLLSRGNFLPSMRALLKALEAAYQHPVELEFTLHLKDDDQCSVNLVQCRPLATIGDAPDQPIPASIEQSRLLFSSVGNFMGTSLATRVHRLIRIDGPAYSKLSGHDKRRVAEMVGALNRRFEDAETCPTVLIGPGRWGTRNPQLGVPVGFADINRVTLLVEVADMGAGLIPDLSFGSHFFQDLVETRIGYLALFPGHNDSSLMLDNLANLPSWPADDLPDGFTDLQQVMRCHDLRQHEVQLRSNVVDQKLLCYLGKPADD